jgi:uncharacterized Zn finger protein
MVQAIVERPAFQIAHQYLTENRVQIVEADEVHISGVVIGNSGVYEQTIRLKDGSLGTKCTCPLNEEPFCRHTVAVLLEYHRWMKPSETQHSPDRPEPAKPSAPPSQGAVVLDIKLSEATAFIEWVDAAVTALAHGHELPEATGLSSTKVLSWVQVIQTIEGRRRQKEEKHAALEADLRAREARLVHMTEQLRLALKQAREARSTSETLERTVAGYEAAFRRLADLV